jgi:hypothetical protein
MGLGRFYPGRLRAKRNHSDRAAARRDLYQEERRGGPRSGLSYRRRMTWWGTRPGEGHEPLLGVLAIVVGAVAVISLYVSAFPPESVRNVGGDADGYIVQIRAARLGVLDLQGTRPGVGVAGSVFAGAGLMPPGVAPILLSIAIAACLGLAAGVAVRTAYGLPGWSVGIVAAIVATWGGTSRLASGYLANLLSLALFVLFLAIAVARGRGRPSPTLVAVAVSSLFAHPALLPAYGAIVVGWVIVCALRPPPGDRSLDGRSEALQASLALVLGTATVAVVLGIWLGLRPDDVVDFTLIREHFGGRATPLIEWLNPTVTLLMIAAGGIVAFLLRKGRSPAVVARLGIPWLAFAGAGLLAPLVFPGLPGHRTVLLGVPAPMLGGLAVAGGAHLLMTRGRGNRRRIVLAVGVMTIAATVSLGVALLGLRPFDQHVSERRPRARTGASAVAGYLRSIDARRPVVIVVDPAEDSGIRFLKARQNTVRALAPDAVFLRIVTYLGDERELLEGSPTRRRGDAAATFNAASARIWPAVRSVLDEDPIIVAVRQWSRAPTWRRLADRVVSVAPDVAVVHGPVPRGPVPLPQKSAASRSQAAIRISSALLLLGLLGGGWSVATWIGRGSVIDATGLAPALGLCVVVLVGVSIALLGGDPGGPAGLAAVVLAGAAGWIDAWRRTRTRGSTMSPYERSASASSTRSTSPGV